MKRTIKLKITGIKGDKGDSPTKDELVSLITPLIPEPIKGDDYVLTDSDKTEIASKIEVPVVDRIIETIREKTEVIREQPIEIIKEVAVLDENRLKQIEDKADFALQKSSKTVSLVELDDVNLDGLTQTDGKYNLGSAGGGIQSIVAGTNIAVDDTDPANPIVSSTGLQSGDNISELVNDVGYITSSDLSGYVPNTGAIYDVDLGTKTITAQSFIVTGGTSSEFLKADGSVDSTSYYPSSNPSGYTSNVGTVTGATDTTLTLTGTTLGLNLANANTWTDKQTFQLTTTQFESGYNSTNNFTSTTSSTGQTVLLAKGTTNGFIFKPTNDVDDVWAIRDKDNNRRVGFSSLKDQLSIGDGGYNSSNGLVYIYDLTHSFKDVMTIVKPTWGSCLSLAVSTQSPVIKASGGSTFVNYTLSDTGTYLANSFTRGSSFDVRNDNDNYGTYGFYAKGYNNNSAPSTSGTQKRGVSYGVVGEAQSNATGNGGAGLRSYSASSNIDGVRVDVLSGQTAPLFRARTVDNINDASQTVATDIMTIDAKGGINPASMADSSANNNSIYYSTTQSKLVYKDSAGTVNNLY